MWTENDLLSLAASGAAILGAIVTIAVVAYTWNRKNPSGDFVIPLMVCAGIISAIVGFCIGFSNYVQLPWGRTAAENMFAPGVGGGLMCAGFMGLISAIVAPLGGLPVVLISEPIRLFRRYVLKRNV